MKKLGVLLFLLGTAIPCFSDFSSRLNLKTQDGTVNTYPYQARFSNGSLTDNNDGTVSVKGSILSQSTLQAGSTFYVTSGTVQGLFTVNGNIETYGDATFHRGSGLSLVGPNNLGVAFISNINNSLSSIYINAVDGVSTNGFFSAQSLTSTYGVLATTVSANSISATYGITASTITISTMTVTGQIKFSNRNCLETSSDGTCVFSMPDNNSMYQGYNTNLINNGGVFNYASGPTCMPYPGAGNFNSCVGPFGMSGNVITIAENNNSQGYASCGALRAGFYNSCFGGSSGNLLRDGNYNTFSGAYAGERLTDQNGNTNVGFESSRYNTSGEFITSVGYQSCNGTTTLNANTSGSGLTCIGKQTGQDVPSATTINNSAAIGIGALYHASNELQLGGRLGSGFETLTRTSSMTVESGFMQVAGKNVCLADGTNCVVTASSSTFGSTSTTYGNAPWVTMTSSGSSQGLLIKSYGKPSGGYQNQIGAVTIVSTTTQVSDMGVPAPLLVLVDSTTDAQVGTGILEIWENNPLHNDPLIWIHNTANTSNPFLRVDDPAPDIEIVNTSTDNAHGYGKWEIASAFQAKTLQINNRAYDNSTFENLLEFNSLSAASNDALGAPGIYLKVQSLDNDSGVLTSSDTSQIRFIGQNGSSVGLTGPLNPVNGSYAFGLPIIPKSAGQLLYFQANRGNNFSVRQTTWTDTDFTYSPTTGLQTPNISKYNNISTVSNGIPAEYATIDTTGLTANVGASTLYAVPAAGAGMYRISSYTVETTAGSVSSTLPNVQIVYTDKETSGSITIDATPVLGVAGIGQTGALTSNTVGTASSGVIVISVKASTTIQYQTVNYASNLAGMTYAIHLKLEAL